jgi:hypothetical protein
MPFNYRLLFQHQGDPMSDLYLGVLLVIGAMTLIFFGPELGKTVGRKYQRSRHRFPKSRHALRKGQKVRTRKVSLMGHLAHI